MAHKHNHLFITKIQDIYYHHHPIHIPCKTELETNSYVVGVNSIKAMDITLIIELPLGNLKVTFFGQRSRVHRCRNVAQI